MVERVFWEVESDTGVSKFALEHDAREDFAELKAYAIDPKNRYRGPLKLRKVAIIEDINS